jgi:hypothetical protein
MRHTDVTSLPTDAALCHKKHSHSRRRLAPESGIHTHKTAKAGVTVNILGIP